MLRYKDPLKSSFNSPGSRSPDVHTKMLLGNLLNLLVFGLLLILQRNLEKDLVIDSKMNRCKGKGVCMCVCVVVGGNQTWNFMCGL